MSLPPALARWAEPLAVLDPVLASVLGPLLIRLAAAFGPLGGKTRKGGDEPDGYAGITRRGKLEHLLTTEWGLLDTAPEEFLRRLSQGELSFLEPERKANAQERRCLILFDCGPEQLGAPRIAQLAAWIVLAQRAAAAGATLQWASLDSEPKESILHSGFDETTVRAFLWSRTATQATPRQLYDWRKFAESALGSPEELWLLGGPRWLDVPMARGVHLMSTQETESSENGGALALTLRPSGKKLQLALPPPDTQIRLLRDPFTPIGDKPGKARVSPRQAVGALVWLPGGKFVAARDSADTGVLVFPVPTKQGASLGPAKLYQQHYARIRAIGGHNNAIFCIAKGGDKLEARLLKGSCAPFPNKPVTLGEADKNLFGYASAELALAVLSFENQPQGEFDLSFSPLDNTPEYWKEYGRLNLCLLQDTEKLCPKWRHTIQDIRTIYAADNHSILRVEATDGASFLGNGARGDVLYWLGKITQAILFSGPSPKESVVVKREDGRWYLPLESKDIAFPALDPDDTILGATYFGGQVRLVTLSEAGRIVRLVGLGGTKTITGIGGKIVSASVSPDVPLVACLRESGDLMIWDLEANARRCQFHAPRETFEEIL